MTYLSLSFVCLFASIALADDEAPEVAPPPRPVVTKAKLGTKPKGDASTGLKVPTAPSPKAKVAKGPEPKSEAKLMPAVKPEPTLVAKAGPKPVAVLPMPAPKAEPPVKTTSPVLALEPKSEPKADSKPSEAKPEEGKPAAVSLQPSDPFMDHTLPMLSVGVLLLLGLGVAIRSLFK